MIPFLRLVVLLMALIQSWKKWLTQHLATHSLDDFMILHSYILILPPSPPTKGSISRIKAFGATALNNKHNHVVVTCCYHLSQLNHLKFLDGLIEDCNERQVWPPVCTPTWWFSTTARPIGLEPNPEGRLELNQNESTN